MRSYPNRAGVVARDDELDALRTERNSAVAEAKMWLSRLLKTQKELDQYKTSLYQCNKCLDEWIEAHGDLLRQFRRLEVAHGHALYDIDNADFLLQRLDPFLPDWMQNAVLRAANKDLYANIAKHRHDECEWRSCD